MWCAADSRGDSGTAPEPGLDGADIEAVRQGDEDAFRRLVERHQQAVARQMWRFTRDAERHEELVQDVFVEAYLGLESYRGDAPFSHWLAVIATRRGYKFWREKGKARDREPWTIQEWDAVTDPRRTLESAEAAELLERLLGGLPARDRLVLTLRFVEDRSVEETADLTGWSPSMVKVQVFRARQKLKKRLKEIEKEAAS